MEEKEQTTPTEIEKALEGLTRINIIRTETVISKLPIHNLSKKGLITIQIVRRNAKGEVTLKWEVSPSRNYGDPRQLAYKLDTLVINRKFEEQGRPLPKFVRLGSLRQIGSELGIPDNTDSIKKALHQNAGAYITAKLTYVANDGTQKSLEAGFTRYSVVFTGEGLPDGQTADAVYLILNDPYRDVLNNAPVRPLNYDYLKELTPAAQRFYEVVSRQIFAALKYQHAEARLPYSEYCTYSAQQRYFDYDRFKKQMYKVHRPHLASGYLKSIRYDQTKDADGKMDWNMYYTPGPKARVEYQTFTRSGRVIDTSPETIGDGVEISMPVPRAPRRHTGPRQKRLKFDAPKTKTPITAPVLDDAATVVLAEMTRRGISDSKARALLAASTAEAVLDQIEWGDVQASRNGDIRNPAGFYIYLIEEKIFPPAGFETSRRRKEREEAERVRQEQTHKQWSLEDSYRTYREEAIAQYIQTNHLDQEVAQLANSNTKEVTASWPGVPATVRKELAERKARAIIAERAHILTFEEFTKREQEKPRIRES